MIRFVTDEDFNRRIALGMLRRVPALDLVRVQDELGMSYLDEEILEWAAHERRLLLSHDVNTLVPKAYELVAQGSRMSGVIVVPQLLSVGVAIDDLEIIAKCGLPEDFQNRVVFLPLR